MFLDKNRLLVIRIGLYLTWNFMSGGFSGKKSDHFFSLLYNVSNRKNFNLSKKKLLALKVYIY